MILLTNVVTKKETKMRYLLNRNGWYFYDRRVPVFYSSFDTRRRIRTSLNTQCQRTAIKKIVKINTDIEEYWNSLVEKNETHTNEKFKSITRMAKVLGFDYLPTNHISSLSILELLERVISTRPFIDDEIKAKALLGYDEATLTLSEALKHFWDYSKHKLLNKNNDQQRKWKNPRIKAVNNFINHAGDKKITEITNLDMVSLRDWWLFRVEKENIKSDTVNKDFTHLKDVIETVSTHQELNINVTSIFKNIYLKEDDKGQRASYSSEYIRNKILNKDTLKQLDNETRCLLLACIQTGARPIELVNLDASDIKLGQIVPYIHIRPRKGYSLKTKQSERKIPLVGNCLKEFKGFSNGFDKYRGKSDLLSSTVNDFLQRNNLRPTKRHSLYSFRHSLQDRLNALEIPDRIQCQLMGHKFNRPVYGEGASIEHLQSIQQKIHDQYFK